MNKFENIPIRLNFVLFLAFPYGLVSTRWFIIENLNKYNIVKLLFGFLDFCKILN
jgi:hypothetical protein